VIEVHVLGDRPEERNVERFAALGIREYFLFDRPRYSFVGYRLPPGGKAYQRIPPRAGGLASEVLGLEVAVEGGKLRFFLATALLPEVEERIARLGSMLDATIASKEELAEQLAEEQGRREEAERKLAEALAEIERLRGRRAPTPAASACPSRRRLRPAFRCVRPPGDPAPPPRARRGQSRRRWAGGTSTRRRRMLVAVRSCFSERSQR
jgi:hypothetical protein